jgi:hypothetical protein
MAKWKIPFARIHTAQISTSEMHIFCGSLKVEVLLKMFTSWNHAVVKIKSIIRGHRQTERQAGRQANRQRAYTNLRSVPHNLRNSARADTNSPILNKLESRCFGPFSVTVL